MAHLTMGELNAHRPVIRDHRATGNSRIAQLRSRPGYGEEMLERFRPVLPPGVYRDERNKLRDAQDRALRQNPRAFAWTQLVRAYRDDDIEAIRRWETSFEGAGARRSLRAGQARAESQRARGLAGFG